MTRAEFERRLPEDIEKPTEEDFEIISLVYDYHPSMRNENGKDNIAMLYSFFGMTIIYDMRERAKRIVELENEICDLEEKLCRAKEELQELFCE